MNQLPSKTIAGFHHVGLTVPDVVQAADFFVQALDCELLFTTSPGAPLEPAYADAIHVPAGSRNMGMALLRTGGAVLELFQYSAPDQALSFPVNSDIGGHHFAFRVIDLEAALARLQSHGASPSGPIRTAMSPQFRGMRWVYVRAPFGLQLELVDFPNGEF